MKWPLYGTILILTILLGLGHGCSDVRLKPADYANYSSSVTSLQFCTTPSDAIKSNLKFIFIVDRSGSNKQRYDLNNNNAPLPGTDPDGTRRFDALMRFVQAYQADPNIYWSMINFGSGVLGNPNFQGFTNDKTAFYNFVSDQKTRTAQIDGGGTNYLDALDRAYDMIQEDIDFARTQNPKISSNYVLFFISDGEPIVTGQAQSSDAILNKVRSIALFEAQEKLLVEGIQLNTGYYYSDPVEPAARTILNNMSIEGNGDFSEFGAGQEIDFSRFAVPLRISKYDMKELWVVNLNTLWEGNRLVRDQDGDGLSDNLEATLGSNPTLPDSDNNGVRDGVEYRISGGTRACKDPMCLTTMADPYTTCRSLQVNGTYPDTDGDFLNDCEEKLLGSNLDDFDSNSDYIPDDLSFRVNMSMSDATDVSHIDPDFDGLSDYQELKLNSPMRYPNSGVPGLTLLRVMGQKISSDSQKDCYSYSVTNLVTLSHLDRIRIYLLENTKAFSERKVMRVVTKQVYGDQISATDAEFVRVGAQ